MIKVGQKVKLNEKAKPYKDHETGFLINEFHIDFMKNSAFLVVASVHTNKDKTYADVSCLDSKGVRIIGCRVEYDWLSPLEEPTEQNYSNDAIEIRKFIVSELGIDHADRFQEVYEWITGEK